MLFYSSLFALMLYRILSSIWVLMTTKSIFHATLQFLDIEIFHKLYLNFSVNTTEPHPIQTYIQMLHVTLESFFQLVIQSYFLIKTHFDVKNNTVIIVSLIFSAINVATKMTSEDKIYFIKEWKSLGLRCKDGIYINHRYLIRLLIRIMDVILRVSFLVIVWIVLGDIAIIVYIGFELIVLALLALSGRRYDAYIAWRVFFFSVNTDRSYPKLMHCMPSSWYKTTAKLIIDMFVF